MGAPQLPIQQENTNSDIRETLVGLSLQVNEINYQTFGLDSRLPQASLLVEVR